MARRRSNGMLLMLALHALSQYMQLDRKPPVTAALILANVIVFLRPGALDEMLPSVGEVCLNPHLILRDLDVRRLLLSGFYHVDETHLVYNMLSLLWKGVQLESSMGSRKFATMVTVLLATSHGLMVALARLASAIGDSPAPLYSHCAVGFSAVLFALKVILNHNSPANSVVYGVVLPARYAAWAELLFIQMFVPGSSFLGHLSGILAGLLYLYAPAMVNRNMSRGWLSWPWTVVTAPWRLLFGARRRFGGGFVGGNSSRNRGGGDDRRGTSSSSSGVWRCSACTYDNPLSLDACDMCATPRPLAGSSSDFNPSAPPWPAAGGEASDTLTLNDVRRARLARFSR